MEIDKINKILDSESREEKEILDDVEFINLPDWWFRIANILFWFIIALIVIGCGFLFTQCSDDYVYLNKTVEQPIVNNLDTIITPTTIDEVINK